ncbi:hypothetical protein BJV77DRAFT_699673, partial [Russula vinacea]
MRGSWTDINALYAAMKGSPLQGHQPHGDLDCGNFVLDALGMPWAGELGSGDYNAPDYLTAKLKMRQVVLQEADRGSKHYFGESTEPRCPRGPCDDS